MAVNDKSARLEELGSLGNNKKGHLQDSHKAYFS